MADKTVITVQDCLAGAYHALLRGDIEERDKLCAMAEMAFQGQITPIPGNTPIPFGKANN